MLDRRRAKHGQGKPPTIHRALDFLPEQGLIDRVEPLNAFIVCHEEWQHEHPVQFLICSRCGTVAEFDDAAIDRAVSQIAARSGFSVTRATVEVEGLCATCKALPS